MYLCITKLGKSLRGEQGGGTDKNKKNHKLVSLGLKKKEGRNHFSKKTIGGILALALEKFFWVVIQWGFDFANNYKLNKMIPLLNKNNNGRVAE